MSRHTVEVLQRPAHSGQFLNALLHAGEGKESVVAAATRTSAGWDHLTYGELGRCVDRVAAGLRAQGVKPGDRVVLAGEPGGVWLSVLFGALRCGAVAVPLDPALTPSEMEPMVARSEPRVVLGPAEMVDLAEVSGPRATRALETPDDSAPDRHTTGGGSAPPDDPPLTQTMAAVRSPDDPALIVWTSGTTGAPKGVTLTFANIAYSVEQVLAGQKPSPDDRWLSVLPAHHLLELCCGLLPALASGGSVWFARTLMPKEIASIVREQGITKMVAVPLLLRILQPALKGSGLGTVYCGGAPLDPAVVERYAAMGIAVHPGYGLTEVAPTVSMNTPEHNRAGSVGRPLAGTDIRIATEGSAADGEILVRSPAVMLRYWEDEALTVAAVDAEGWLHTGDLGHVDEDGYLFVTGRCKRLVVLESGKKVQPEEVEGALAAGGRFSEVCAVGVRVDGKAEQVCAVVVPTPAMAAGHPDAAGLHEAAVVEVARLTSSLSGYKRPTVVKVHHGAFPLTQKGAPRHTEVARMVEEGNL
ncbi:MAG TPA: class I adenylate-forming enzyme family protein [Acidimicrobiales bacterium]|nr:class I adenylate-forming enzyme family protein [Acidimicrobiales bacterium]